MKIESKVVKIEELIPTSNNPRQIKKKDFEILKKSLRDFPEMRELREIVVDENMTILGGHQRAKALKAIGEKEVIVKQVFGLSDEKKREFIIKDNIANGDWDMDILANEWDDEPLDEWGLEINIADDEETDKDLMDIEIPIYEPSSKKPKLSELLDDAEYRQKMRMIDESSIPDELKEILRIRASFFVDFNFQKIADYYAHSDNETKRMIEGLGMVILAPKEAVMAGIARLKTGLGFDDED